LSSQALEAKGTRAGCGVMSAMSMQRKRIFFS